MNWFYSKDGQQAGPVAFSEIERLYAEGQLADDSLVWQQGTPNWVKLSTVLAAKPPALEPAAIPSSPAPLPAASLASSPTVLPDYGNFLCWGFIGVPVPCVGGLIYIALMVFHCIEYFAVRQKVAAGELQPSSYSRVHPALFIIGLFCGGCLLYPYFMYLREKAGYFKPQPTAVLVAIVISIICIALGILSGISYAHEISSMSSTMTRIIGQ